ncbi:MAG: 23S rRNA (uracil(1939)-C(5))-methyltransferase RlmD [Myxococcota bacterium]|nr:23S rRNA (uracil(1939)-C(5))-methyltransferase RlmD [Myxococcota bacterium]
MADDAKVTPEAWVPRGEAVITRGRRRLLIWGGIPGEEAIVRIYRQGQHQDMARFLEPFRQPHPLRREPPCDKYTLCGGCPLMHLTTPGQHRARLALIRYALREYGLESHTPEAVVPSPDGDEEYRHVVKVVIGYSDRGSVRLGALGRDSRTIVPIPKCTVATDKLRMVMGALAHHILRLEIHPYDTQRDWGVLRYAVIRQSRSTGEMLLTLVAGRKDRLLGELVDAVSSQNPDISAIHLHLNDSEGNAIFDRDEDGRVGVLPMRGNMVIEDELGGVKMQIGPGDFFQINPAMADVIVADVLEAFAGDRDRPALDLYSGVGGFALALGKAHGWALGIEGITSAVTRARANARLNRISAEFIAGDVAEVLPDVKTRLDGRAPVVVVDPARRGLEDGVIDGLIDLNPARLAYLSCNPRTMARDMARFVEAGWKIESVRAYDMFPQTAHVETLAILTPAVAPPPVTRRAPRRKIVR